VHPHVVALDELLELGGERPNAVEPVQVVALEPAHDRADSADRLEHQRTDPLGEGTDLVGVGADQRLRYLEPGGCDRLRLKRLAAVRVHRPWTVHHPGVGDVEPGDGGVEDPGVPLVSGVAEPGDRRQWPRVRRVYVAERQAGARPGQDARAVGV